MTQPENLSEEPCPVCLRESWYWRALDRYIHVDGSANVDCWVYIARGDLEDEPRWITDARSRAPAPFSTPYV